jgi:hypothetical protein
LAIHSFPVARALIAACLSGAILGLAARVAMRLVALEAGVAVGFSPGGSLEVVAFGALVGAPVALLFFALRAWRRVRHPWLGVLCGLALFCVLGTIPPPAARSALATTPDTTLSTALVFCVVFVGWGVMLEYFARRFLLAR